MAKKSYVTTKGVASFPHLNSPDFKFDKDGTYHVKLVQTPAEAEGTMEFLSGLVKESLAQAKLDNPKVASKIDGVNPWNEDSEEHPGMIVFNFKMAAHVEPKNGKTPFDQKPALFDSKLAPLAEDKRIGGGSEIRVSYTTFPYYIAKDREAGVGLRIVGVQVLKRVEYGGKSGAALGFEAEEDGYTSEASAFAPTAAPAATPEDDEDDDIPAPVAASKSRRTATPQSSDF